MPVNYCPKCGEKLGQEVEICVCGYKITNIERMQREESNLIAGFKSKDFIPGKGIIFAGKWDRLIAFIVDMMFITIIGFLISLPLPIPGRQLGLALIVPHIQDLINWIVGFLYFWLFETYYSGQTIGKKILSLRAVDEKYYTTTTSGKYAINNLLRGSGILLLIDLIIGYIANYDIKGNRLRIMQNASNTVVVKTK
jgi:uncharacterized RDD family membrane protein YckC